MENIFAVAKYLIKSYENTYNVKFGNDSTKLQIFAFLAEFICYQITDKPLYSPSLVKGDKEPEVPILASFFEKDVSQIGVCKDSSAKEIIDHTVQTYGMYSVEYLADLSRTIKSDYYLKSYDIADGAIPVIVNDPDIDPNRMYDHLYDMYVDEFEDVDWETMKFGFQLSTE